MLLLLDEFPALGRLDFFESTLAFMAGYGLKAFLIAQSLNQIEKAYGTNNAILDNCHVRVAFATNDERTAKRISDALGATTEIRAMKNYAGHRLSPWLGHLMVSRQETARPLLTSGEIMQLPPAEEIVMVSGSPPIRAKKVRYYDDPQLQGRILPPPELARPPEGKGPADDWSAAKPIPPPPPQALSDEKPVEEKPVAAEAKTDNAQQGLDDGRGRDPAREEAEDAAERERERERRDAEAEFDHKDGKGRGGRDGEADRLRDMHRGFLVNAKLAALDRGDGLQMDGGR